MIQTFLKRFFSRIIQRFGALNLIQLFLLWLALYSVARGLMAVVERLPAGMMFLIVVLGLSVGWLLGRTRLAGWKSGVIACVAGFLGLVMTVGRIGNPLLVFLTSLGPPLWQSLHCPLPSSHWQVLLCETPNFSTASGNWSALIDSLSTLTARLSGWFRGIFSGIPAIDPLVTTLLWGLVLWLTVTWAAWWMRRRNSIVIGLLPALALLAYNVYYTNNMAGILWLVLTAGGSVLLQAIDTYSKSERRWVAHHMNRVEIELNLAITMVLLAVGLMLSGGFLPSLSIGKISHDLQQIFQPTPDRNLNQSLGFKDTPEVAQAGTTTSNGISLSPAHAIGAGPHLSQKVVMYVTVDGYIPPPPPEVARITNATQPEVRYYWRAQTYDRYNGHAWIDDTSQNVNIAANTPYYSKLAGTASNYQDVSQHVQRLLHMDGALFVAGDLLSVDQPSAATWRATNDLIHAETDPDTYSAVSRIPFVSLDQLRAAGNDFPASLRSRYLTLPDEIPQRVRNLALDLTAHELNLYDRAITIESYLRQFPYSVDVPGPPLNRDVADYFLFDLKKGYCDYYATSMVVLARAAGLPARLVVGYSSGNYDYDNHRFVIVAADAHAWVEIYFPNIGWVEFEPTANEPTIPRPGKVETPAVPGAAAPAAGQQPGAGPGFHIRLPSLRRPLEVLGIVLAGLAVLLVVLPLEGWLLYLRPADQAVKNIYRRLYRRGQRWGIHEKAARTPHEFAAALSTRLEELVKNKRFAPAVSAARRDLDWLTGLYARLLFSPAPPTQEEHHRAVQTWMRLQWKLSWLPRRRI